MASKDKKPKKDRTKSQGGSNEQASVSCSSTCGVNAVPTIEAVPMIHLQATIETEILTKWQTKPFAKFPIHKDIPRFIRSVMVIGYDGAEIYIPDKAETNAAAVSRFMVNLALQLEPQNVSKFKDNTTSKLIGDKVDTETMSLLIQSIDDIELVTSPTLLLLKSCNQGILAPALVNLQLAFMGSKFMFIDINWSILVLFFDKHIRVEHRRYEGFSGGHGHFGWATTFLIRRRDMEMISVKMRIMDYRIPDQVIQGEWEHLIKPILFLDPLPACTAIFDKTWDRLPIAKDIVRFATKTTILLGSNQSDIASTSSDALVHVKFLLLEFAKLFDDSSLIEQLENTFDSNVIKLRASDLNTIIKSYFSDVLMFDDSKTVTRLCKFFTQSILAPLATNIQLELSKILPIKDGPTWTISIGLVPEGLVIKHSKQQLSMDQQNPSKSCSFVWKAEFTVTRDVSSLISVRTSLVSLNFLLKTENDSQQVQDERSELSSLLEVLLSNR